MLTLGPLWGPQLLLNYDGSPLGNSDTTHMISQILRGVYTPFAVHFGWPKPWHFRSHFKRPTNASALVARWCEQLLAFGHFPP